MNNTITISKALGIVLMVIAHAGIPWGQDIIYMFHMPLFFILAGYCFKEKYVLNVKEFIKHRLIGLYLPFVFFSLLFIAFHNCLYDIYLNDNLYKWEIYGLSYKELLLSPICSTLLFFHCEQLLGGYWFLPQLFFGSIIGLFTIMINKSCIIGAFVLLFTCIITKSFNIAIPYSCLDSTSLFAAFFFVTGYILKKNSVNINGYISIVGICLVVIGSYLWPSSVTSCTPLNVIPYSATAIIGSLVIMYLSSIINKFNETSPIKRLLLYIGYHTLSILTWHFLSFKVISYLIILIENRPICNLTQFPIILTNNQNLWWMAYTAIGICIPLIFAWPIEYIVKRIKR